MSTRAADSEVGPAEARSSDRFTTGLSTAVDRVCAVAARQSPVLALGIVAFLLLALGIFLYDQMNGTSFYFDDWLWISERRENTLDAFLKPHNDHLSAIPIALNRVMWVVFGMDSYTPYKLLVLLGHFTCIGLAYTYAVKRLGWLVAILPVTLLACASAAWEDIFWPFQIAWFISVGAGISALLLLDLNKRWADVVASLMVLIALGSSGLGIPVLIMVAADVAFGRRRIKDAWIVVVPLLPYLLWWALYQESYWVGATERGIGEMHPLLFGIYRTPYFAFGSGASTLTSLTGFTGLSQAGVMAPGTFLVYGTPLLALFVAWMVWRLKLLGTVPARVIALTAGCVGFWVFTGITRGALGQPFISRYLYFGCAFVLLLGVELMPRMPRVTRWVGLGAVVLVAATVLANLAGFRVAGGYMRTNGERTTAVLGAFDLGRPAVVPGYKSSQLPGTPAIPVPASAIYSAEEAYGTMAESEAQIIKDGPGPRAAVDTELVGMTATALKSGDVEKPGSTRPQVAGLYGRLTAAAGGCVTFGQQAVTPNGQTGTISVTVPATGILVRNPGDQPVNVGLRRYGDSAVPLGAVSDGQAATVVPPKINGTLPWLSTVTFTDRVQVCGLG